MLSLRATLPQNGHVSCAFRLAPSTTLYEDRQLAMQVLADALIANRTAVGGHGDDGRTKDAEAGRPECEGRVGGRETLNCNGFALLAQS